MSEDSRKQRERLKEEYKEHYRKMRETRERLNRAKKTKSIKDALRNMDTSEMMETFDDILFNVKSKLASVEARLEVAMDSLTGDDKALESMDEEEREEELKKTRARETLKQVKLEMGKLYNEIEKQASSIHIEKTIGSQKPEQPEDDNESQG